MKIFFFFFKKVKNLSRTLVFPHWFSLKNLLIGKLYFDTVPSLGLHWKNPSEVIHLGTIVAAWDKRQKTNHQRRKDTPPSVKLSKPSNGLHYAITNLFEAFMHSPHFIQFKDAWIAEKLLFTYGIYEMLMLFIKLWVSVNSLLQVKLQFSLQTEKLSSQEKTINFTQVIQFNLFTFYSRARKWGLNVSIPFHFL